MAGVAGLFRAQVVPFALLVPFVGAAASALFFRETFGRCGLPEWSCGLLHRGHLLSKRSQALPKSPECHMSQSLLNRLCRVLPS